MRKKRLITSPGTLLSVGILTILLVGAAYIYGQFSTEDPIMQDTRTINDTTGLLQGQWDYMPGVAPAGGKLEIKPVNRTIVNRDGSGGQPNPAINLYGTYLHEATAFAVTATIRDLKDTATMQLYGRAPIIADEFRVERQSVRLTVAKGSLKVALWDGTDQQSVLSRDFPFGGQTDGSTIELKVTHRDNMLAFFVDDVALGTLNAKEIFKDRSVWFGLDGTGPWTLADLDVHALDGEKLKVADSSTLTVKTADGPVLQRLASQERSGFTIGAAMALGPSTTDPEYAKVAFGGNFGSLTTENALKWQFVHPQPGTYTFQEADALVALAQKHHMAVHGHALVFGEANPPWVHALPLETDGDKENIKKVMLNHIAKVVGHYKGKVASWDVVNEPFDEDDWSKLRPHLWYKAMGAEYIAEAFRAAHKADPEARLYMNDWALEMDPDRWNALVALLKDLKSKNVPIHGVGFQAHVYHRDDRIDTAVLKRRIQELAKMGFDSRISEIDVYSEDGVLVQGFQYADVLETCLTEPSCVSYTTWGVSDRYNTYKDDDGTIAFGRDFLWTAEMKPTPAVAELQRILAKE